MVNVTVTDCTVLLTHKLELVTAPMSARSRLERVSAAMRLLVPSAPRRAVQKTPESSNQNSKYHNSI